MARENTNWGARRIVGELRKLGLVPSRSTVRRVMIDEGLPPRPGHRAPKDVATPWRLFVNAHLNTMVACDFFCKSVFRGWTPLGKRLAHCLMFIHLSSRKVFVSPCTYEPNKTWVNQQARNLILWLEDEGLDVTHILHDRDTKFTASFDALFKSAGVQRVRSPIQSPIANCYAESWIGTLKRECLNHLFCFSLRHLDHIVQTYVRYYNTLRPHQSLGNVPLGGGVPPHDAPSPEDLGTIRRHALLAGLLNHYERKAA
jgi:putative transposase